MKHTEIRAAIHRRPFVPFELSLADGRSLPVIHPESILVSTDAVVVVTLNADRSKEQMHIVDLPNIVRVSFNEQVTAP